MNTTYLYSCLCRFLLCLLLCLLRRSIRRVSCGHLGLGPLWYFF